MKPVDDPAFSRAAAPAVSPAASPAAAPAHLAAVKLRLLLAILVLARYLAEPDSANWSANAWLPLFSAFALYNMVVFLLCMPGLCARRERALLDADIAWLSVMVAASGGAGSPFSPFYMLIITSGALRFGGRAGLRVTLLSLLAYLSAALVARQQAEPATLLTHAALLFAVGAAIACLGALNQRRLARLRGLPDAVVRRST